MHGALGVAILCALVAELAVTLAVDLLNLRAMRPTLPPGFEDVYDADGYARSQRYTRERTRFSVWPRLTGLALVLAVWLPGGFGALDAAVRAELASPIAQGLAFVAVLVLGRSLVMLPFRYYATFVIEERFGFNRSSRATFWGDQLKVLLLSALLGGPALALVLFVFERGGSLAWAYCWGVLATLTLLLQFVAPSIILPMFNRFTPLDEGALRERIFDYARSVGFPLEKLFVIDGSRRSSKANAFFTGFGKHKRIALFDTLIARHGVDELVAVVAHEIGHYQKRHILQSMVLGVGQLGLLLYLFGLLLGEPALFAAFGVEAPSVHAGLVFASLLYAPFDRLVSLWLLARSRRHEYEADRFAAETTGLAAALATALKKLSADSLANLTPHRAYGVLHHSHPPVIERVAALQALPSTAR